METDKVVWALIGFIAFIAIGYVIAVDVESTPEPLEPKIVKIVYDTSRMNSEKIAYTELGYYGEEIEYYGGVVKVKEEMEHWHGSPHLDRIELVLYHEYGSGDIKNICIGWNLANPPIKYWEYVDEAPENVKVEYPWWGL